MITISGFTFVRNAVRFDYPLVESIRSILPLVDEFVVNVGDCDDGTRELVEAIGSPKIRIIDSVWDPRFVEKSRILAVQTNIALYQCTGDWCFYIQADEVFHPEGLQKVRQLVEQAHPHREIEGILLDYVHFFGDYSWCSDSYIWYRKEIRLLRNHIGVTSYKDAQGFRLDCKKMKVIDSGLKMHHYGWVRLPLAMAEKKAYHDSIHHQGKSKKDNNFRYENYVDPKALKPFGGTHPELMKERIAAYPVTFSPQSIRRRFKWKSYKARLVNALGKLTGFYPGEYRGYKIARLP